MSRRLALAAALILALTSATAASASTVGNGGDPAARLTIGSPGVGEVNTFTIAYAASAGTTPSGYTVHDATADMTLGTCTGGCTLSGDNRTAFVPALQGVTVQV